MLGQQRPPTGIPPGMRLEQREAQSANHGFRARLQNYPSAGPYGRRFGRRLNAQIAAISLSFKTQSPAISALPAGLSLTAEPEGDG